MAIKKIGVQTIKFDKPPCIISGASIAGPKEGMGPLKNYFDVVLKDDMWGEKSYEKAECKMFKEAVKLSIEKSKKQDKDIDYIVGGDLLNQLISSNYAARDLKIPYFGLYGACSTMAESLSIGSIIIDGGFADNLVCVTSSHFSTAERQYRFPLEYGGQRSPSAQWTVTGSGSTVLSSNEEEGPYVTHVTTGKVIDLGIKDSANMGSAMAPAAADTMITHFQDTGRKPADYDLIVTGDLGWVGNKIVTEILKLKGYDLGKRYNDCGCLIFNNDQDTHAGGSGCGCSAVVFNGYILKKMREGKYKRVLLIATGALMSPTSSQQGESIPGIAHAVAIEMKPEGLK